MSLRESAKVVKQNSDGGVRVQALRVRQPQDPRWHIKFKVVNNCFVPIYFTLRISGEKPNFEVPSELIELQVPEARCAPPARPPALCCA